tara:strand:+ start:64 stop:285 length:222 start_codon:yes stop_codon:yes gene_type:complete
MKLIIQKIRDFLLRKKRKSKQLLFFEKIGARNTSRDEMLKNLIRVLEKNGFKIKNKSNLLLKKLSYDIRFSHR